MDKIEEAKRVFDIEIEALKSTRDLLGDVFISILDEITKCQGKVIITGMGKPGHIGRKLAATFSSLGTSSFYLHPAEALHGDLGMVEHKDIVIAISYSGESEEVVQILPAIKLIGAKIIALTSNEKSTLAMSADIVQILPRFKEACRLGLAPTSSTTVELVYGDALAVVASAVYGFKDKDFGRLHPAGNLGKKLLLKVSDLMVSGKDNAVVAPDELLKDVIIEISKKELGMACVADDKGRLLGIITSGDIRRMLQTGININEKKAGEVLNKNPVCADSNEMAIDVMRRMINRDISHMPVIEGKVIVGAIKLSDIIKSGLMGNIYHANG